LVAADAVTAVPRTIAAASAIFVLLDMFVSPDNRSPVVPCREIGMESEDAKSA
jgi:hypothetical protein